MQERVYQTRVHDIEELRQRLITVWCELELHCRLKKCLQMGMNKDGQCNRPLSHSVRLWMIVDDAIDQWRRRLLACVDAEGRHFEHSL